jgi:ribonuclease HI
MSGSWWTKPSIIIANRSFLLGPLGVSPQLFPVWTETRHDSLHDRPRTGRDALIEVWTDGACSGNPGPGGWAWAIPGGSWAAGAEGLTTNQRMEITAALEAVRANPGRLEVVSDSTYVVHCFRDRWWEGWMRRGWVNSAKKPVANRDLWEPLVELVRGRGDVTFRWVKGHSGDPMNDLVDRLAVEACATQQQRSGVGAP